MNKLGAALLWGGVGIAKMAALACLIDGQGWRALALLVAAWGLAALALRLRQTAG